MRRYMLVRLQGVTSWPYQVHELDNNRFMVTLTHYADGSISIHTIEAVCAARRVKVTLNVKALWEDDGRLTMGDYASYYWENHRFPDGLTAEDEELIVDAVLRYYNHDARQHPPQWGEQDAMDTPSISAHPAPIVTIGGIEYVTVGGGQIGTLLGEFMVILARGGHTVTDDHDLTHYHNGAFSDTDYAHFLALAVVA